MAGPATRLIGWIDSWPVSPRGAAALFFATVLTRNIAEGAQQGLVFDPPAFLLHFPAAYVFPMLGIAALLHLFSGFPAGRMLRMMTYAWTLTMLPPLLDLVAGTRTPIGYFPLDRSNLGYFLMNFLNPAVALPGTTTGIRIEAAAGCLLAGVFVWSTAASRPFLKGVCTALLFFPFFLVFFTWPMLVQMAASAAFPWSPTAQEFLQWHASTAGALTGSVHYTVFLVDLIPVTALLLWFWPRLHPESWLGFRSALRPGAPGMACCLAGTVTALSAASRSVLTFADAASIAGASLAAILIQPLASGAGRLAGTACVITSTAAAAASGWPVPAVSLTGACLALIPAGAAGRRSLASAAGFLVACSPVFLPPAGFAILLPFALLAGAAALPRRPAAAPWLAVVVLLAALGLARPVPLEGAARGGLACTTDAFMRSNQNSHAHLAASQLAASGGPLLPLAETAHLAGDIARSRWVYSIAVSEGDSSTDMLKVGLNLAAAGDDGESFVRIMQVLSSRGEGIEGLPGLVLGRAASEGRTDLLEMFLEEAGPSAAVFSAFSEAGLAQGDTSGAAGFAAAAVRMRDATPADYASAMQLAAISGGDYHSMYLDGLRRFGRSAVLSAARLRAPLLAGRAPDMESLVGECLALAPTDPVILGTCAMWLRASGDPDSALVLAERAVMAQTSPSRSSFEIACACAVSAGRTDRLSSMTAYALSRFPADPGFRSYSTEPGRAAAGETAE